MLARDIGDPLNDQFFVAVGPQLINPHPLNRSIRGWRRPAFPDRHSFQQRLCTVRSGNVEIDGTTFGNHAAILYDGEDGCLLAFCRRNAYVEYRCSQFIGRQKRVPFRRMDDIRIVVANWSHGRQTLLAVYDAELRGGAVHFLNGKGRTHIQEIPSRLRLANALLVNESQFIDNIDVPVLLPEIVAAQIGVFLSFVAVPHNGTNICAGQWIGLNDAYISGCRGQFQFQSSIFLRRRLGHVNLFRNEDLQTQPTPQVDQIIRETIPVPIDQAKTVVRIHRVGKQVIMLDNLRRHIENQRIDLNTFIGPMTPFSREFAKLAVQRTLHDPVPVGRTLRGYVSKHQTHLVPRHGAKRTAHDGKIDQQPRFILDNLRLTGIYLQIRGLAIPRVLNEKAQFERLISKDLFRYEIVKIELWLRMNRDLHRIRLGLFQQTIHIVAHDGFDPVRFTLQFSASKPLAGNENPPSVHGGVSTKT